VPYPGCHALGVAKNDMGSVRTIRGTRVSRAIRKAEAYVRGEKASPIACRLGRHHRHAIAVACRRSISMPPTTSSTQPLRYTHVAFVLLLSFLLFPAALRFRNRIRWWDVVAGLTCVGILIYAIMGGDDFTDRATSPLPLDVLLGVIFIVLLLEASRRDRLIVP
jgi:hypothetical protein